VRRTIRIALTLAAATALVGGLALFLARDDWNWARPLVEWGVERTTGREVEIRGDLSVDLGLTTAVRAHAVRVGNASWARAPDLLIAERMAFRFRLLPLLHGVLRLRRLEADALTLELERSAEGVGNWELRSSGSGAAEIPGTVLLHDVELRFTDPARPHEFRMHVAALRSRRIGPVRSFHGVGTYQGGDFTLEGALLGTPELDAGRVPLRLRARVGSTALAADGSVDPRSEGFGLAARLGVRGESLDDVWRLVGFPLPHSPPFTLTGHLSYDAGTVRMERLAGQLGRSDIDGEITVRLAQGRRMRIEADVRSRAIDLDDVEGFWGRPVREERRAQPAARAGAPESVFPDFRFELSKLRVADARIRFVADRVQGKTVLDHVRLTATIDNGVLELREFALGMAAGALAGTARIDARGEIPRLDAELVVRNVRLDELLARAGLKESGGGELGGRAELRAQGRSLHELARSVDGEIGTVLQSGWISDPLLELLALHLGGYIRARMDKDDPGPIRCLVGVFEAEQGVLEARTLLLDTSHVRIEGEGRIDLGREELDLELEQHSKHITVGALKTPIEIVGPFTSRTARLKPGPLVARGGAAAALASAIHPLAALLALVDVGRDDKPAACSEALAEYRPIAAQTDVPAQSAPGSSPPR
jgi:uncharacterized protein involved in outer membrane biogenesis